MGGIAGIVRFDKTKIDNILLEKMSSAIQHRGSGGIFHHITGRTGLCNLTSNDTGTPQQEIFHPPGSDQKFAITFHGRIDNRTDLYAHTSKKHSLDTLSDGQLVLEAYKRSGNKFIEKLLGDFSFAIWDDTTQTLFCGRDHMGVKPFYYINTGAFFAFSSEIKSLLLLPGVKKEINREKIADFMVCLTTDNKSTFYSNIFSLAPAHTLTVQNLTVKENNYWQLEPADIHLKSDQEYQEAFFDIFKEAVRTRLQPNVPVGAYLSGGIDSPSIVCMVAAHLRKSFNGSLHTFSGIFDKIPTCDERSYFQPILDRFSPHHHQIYADKLYPGKIFDTVSNYEDEPFFSPHFFMSWYLLNKAKQNGVRVLLDGHDGDSAVSYGYGLMPELAMQGQLIKLYREFMEFPNATLKSTLKNIARLYWNLVGHKLPQASFQTSSNPQWLENIDSLTSTYQDKTNIRLKTKELLTKLPKPWHREAVYHKLNISQPFHPLALEFLERAASQFGINHHFPFFDIRLISFCLALPANQKLEKGYNRSIVRKSLQSILPDTITKRKLKTNFSKNLSDAFCRRDKEWLSLSMREISPEIFTIIKKEKLENAYNDCLATSNSSSTMSLSLVLRSIALSKWLKKL